MFTIAISFTLSFERFLSHFLSEGNFLISLPRIWIISNVYLDPKRGKYAIWRQYLTIIQQQNRQKGGPHQKKLAEAASKTICCNPRDAPLTVAANYWAEIRWDFKSQTDKLPLLATQPGNMNDKQQKREVVRDVAIPADSPQQGPRKKKWSVSFTVVFRSVINATVGFKRSEVVCGCTSAADGSLWSSVTKQVCVGLIFGK